MGTNISEILIEIHMISFKKMHLKMSSGKWRPFCISPLTKCCHIGVAKGVHLTPSLEGVTMKAKALLRRSGGICTGLILSLRPANERRRYFVTTSLIGWAQAWNQPYL